MRSMPLFRNFTSAAAKAAALVAAACLVSTIGAAPLAAQPSSVDRGAAALGSTLAGIGTTGRVLTIAAHPDDEDTQFIALLTRGRHVETAYLSLTRGDGGQNLIGNELGEALGVIRTQELMAARRIDGGRQYFTRAYDFGFSKNAEETYTHWPKDSILGDVVRVVRAFRPHIVVAFFSGTPRDGHGHHQVSGLLAREAYDAAGDTIRFPVGGYGLPWTPGKFYRSARQDTASGTLRMNVGEYDPLLGRSYYEIAAESRSQHKSQGFGVLQRKGVIFAAVRREAARVGPAEPRQETSLFDGIDTTWSGLRTRVPAAAQPMLDSALTNMRIAREQYRAADPTPIVQPLAAALRQLTAVRRASGAAPAMLLSGRPVYPPVMSRRFPNATDPALYDALSTSMSRVETALVLAAGVAVEATAPRETFAVREAVKINVSDSIPVAVTIFNRGRVPVTFLSATAGVGVPRSADSALVSRDIAPDSALTVNRYAVAFETTSQWWRAGGRKGFDWFQQPIDARDEAQQQARSAPTVQTGLNIAGQPVVVSAPVVYRYADPLKGDQQKPVAAVPGIVVNLQSAMEYLRAGVPVERMMSVRIQSAYTHDAKVTVKLELPKGLVADSVERVRVLPPQGVATITFRLRGIVAEGRHQLAAIAFHEGSFSTSGSYTIAYEHITPMRMYGSSGMYLSAVSVKLPPRARVGYIVGVGDAGMEALQQLDVTVEKIEPAMLASTDLSRFTSIVVGPRAYESNDVVVRNNPRLLDYARRGGSLVVQYGAQDMSRFPVTPFPMTWTRPAARVTLEGAPVRILRPDAPLLTTPNRIGPADWADWVQERATYMPTTASPQYTTFLGMNDPEEPENVNGVLQAKLGRGTYTYVTLALFRQLPNGVPGAARLLLNLVAAPPSAPATPPKM